MSSFFSALVHNFFISFGIVVGASVFSGISAIITNHPPMNSMLNVANSMKMWAMAASLGGTFSAFSVIEKGLFEGEIRSLVKQVLFILIALIGANTGCGFIRLLKRCSEIWGN